MAKPNKHVLAWQSKASAPPRFDRMFWIARSSLAVGQVGFLPWMVPSTETVIKQLGEPLAPSLLFGAALSLPIYLLWQISSTHGSTGTYHSGTVLQRNRSHCTVRTVYDCSSLRRQNHTAQVHHAGEPRVLHAVCCLLHVECCMLSGAARLRRIVSCTVCAAVSHLRARCASPS